MNLPCVGNTLKLKLYDYERTVTNELICSLDFNVTKTKKVFKIN